MRRIAILQLILCSRSFAAIAGLSPQRGRDGGRARPTRISPSQELHPGGLVARRLRQCVEAWEGVSEKPADYDALPRTLRLAPAAVPEQRPADGPARRPAAAGQGPQRRLPALPRRLDLRPELRRPGQHLAGHPGVVRGLDGADGCRPDAVHVQQRPRHHRGRRRWRSSCSAAASRTCRCGRTAARPRPARRPVRGRAGLVAAEEEEDDVPHRRRRCRGRCGRSCSS